MPKRTLEQVLEQDPEELPATALPHYRVGTLDEVVYPGQLVDSLPAFAIQFDRESVAPERIRDEVLTNRLCAAARLPLLRVGAEALDELEQVSVLEWVVRRGAEWERDKDVLFTKSTADIEAALEGQELTDELIEDVGLTFDPSFDFDVEHPFPGLALVARRLRTRFDIRVLPGWMAYEDEPGETCYAADLGGGRSWYETTAVSEYLIEERLVRLFRTQEYPSNPLVELRASARFAHAHVIAQAGDAPRVLAEMNVQPPDTPLWDVASMRAEALDFTWLGGASPNTVVRELALYRVLSGLEGWAAEHLSTPLGI